MQHGLGEPIFLKRYYADEVCGREPRDPYWLKQAGEPTEVVEAAYAARRTWDQCARRADARWRKAAAVAVATGQVSCGRIDLNVGRGVPIDDNDVQCDAWKRLPKTLYHVTTNRTAVLKRGLRTRKQQRVGEGIGGGVGLGGGHGEAISTSDSRGLAGHIKRAILESTAVAQGRLSVGEMIRQAKKGVGAKRPWLETIYRQHRRHREKRGTTPEAVRKFLRGIVDVRPGRDETRPEGLQWTRFLSEMPKSCTPYKLWGAPKTYKGQAHYSSFWCPGTPEQKAAFALKFYGWWAQGRARAGGPIDPVVTAVDAAGVMRLDPKQVSILKFKSCPGTYGGRVGDKHEWKVVTGRNLKLVAVDGKKPPPWTKPSILRCPKVKKVEIPSWWKEGAGWD